MGEIGEKIRLLPEWGSIQQEQEWLSLAHQIC